MADRYQDRPFPPDDYGRGGDQHGAGRADSDPLAELARLIGQTDPFGTQPQPVARAPAAPQPYQSPAESYPEETYQETYPDSYEEPLPPPGPPAWMRRANVQPQSAPAPRQDYAAAAHPLHRYAAQQPAAPEPDYDEPQAYHAPEVQPDPSRYDDALYGQLESSEQDYQRDPAYPDDPYAYQNDYPEEDVEEPRRRRGGMMTVAAVLALAVVGTGGAFAYRTFMGSPRSGEPPIIKADNAPTKVVPAPTDGTAKLPDRMATGDGTEKIVPREEAPVDLNARSGGPRVVFPPLNPNTSPPPVASVAPSTVPAPSAGPVPSNGTLPNNEPRRIRTLSVKGDQTDGTAPQGAAPAAKQSAAPKAAAPAAPRNPPTAANASANGPLSLAPQAAPAAAPPQRLAATNPTQIAPAPAPAVAGGGYLVQVSSQRSEADAHASYKALQSKFPAVLGSHSPVIKRADLGDKGVYYRAMVGPFGSSDEAAQFCGNLKTAGGQCVVQRN
ncbi:SPOR domain-containing protein [Bradyrhizobium sp.]|uniref:SPOR domain-containing protein n=1 Tax=Bradyrhizobium sp. TaxID=376 RepID=UPI00238D968D|nr:SPOR domain-containing protein [Bradyrhizobium sp.]MDE2378345.1 SPOR domain-containing protein [Bradyrhizobium sp.]